MAAKKQKKIHENTRTLCTGDLYPFFECPKKSTLSFLCHICHFSCFFMFFFVVRAAVPYIVPAVLPFVMVLQYVCA